MQTARPSFLDKYGTLLSIFILGVLASCLAYWIIFSQENRLAENEFIAHSKVSIEILQKTLESNANSLDAVKGFYEATNNIDRTDFREFTDHMIKNHPSVFAYGWLPYIAHKDRSVFEDKMKADGFEQNLIRVGDGFGVFKTSDARADYYPLFYGEPAEGIRRRLGLDLSALPHGGPAIRGALESGQIVASTPINNATEFSNNSVTMIFTPVFNPALENQISQPAENEAQGLVVALFLVGNLIAQEFNDENDLSFHITDVSDPTKPRPVFGRPPEMSGLEYEEVLSFAGRKWQVTSTSPASTYAFHWLSIATLLAGLILTLLVSYSYLSLKRWNEVVESLVERRTDELNKTIEKLADSNEELERFAFVCSHDLQEPLRMIRSFSERLQVHIGDSLEHDEKGKKYFRFITDGAERAQALIADILTYSRISSDTQKLETFEVEHLINVIQENMTANLASNGGRITYDTLPRLTGNKTQLLQLFQNLINNGMKYQNPSSKPHVHIGVQDNGKFWKFSIKDNGIGIEKKHIGKIFDVFQRLHRTSQFAGTGVGLSICKKVVERHGGKVWVDSEKGVGSIFYFTLLKPTP